MHGTNTLITTPLRPGLALPPRQKARVKYVSKSPFRGAFQLAEDTVAGVSEILLMTTI